MNEAVSEDLLYGNENFGPERNAYFEKVAKKMGMADGDLEHADQKVKPKIKEKLALERNLGSQRPPL